MNNTILSPKRHQQTLRTRFAILIAVALSVALSLFSGIVYFALARHLSQTVDNTISIIASQAAAAINIENGVLSLNDALPSSTSMQQQGIRIVIYDPNGVVQVSTDSDNTLPLTAHEITSAQQHAVYLSRMHTGVELRIILMPVVINQQTVCIIAVSKDLADINTTLHSMRIVLILCIPLFVVAMGGIGWWMAARTLRPIDNIIATAQHISTSDLHQRIDIPNRNDEVGRLARTFNHMLTRLEEGFAREREFTANASHELRTPLSTMQAIVDVMRTTPQPQDDYQSSLATLLRQIRRLQSLIDDLLWLARADGQQSNPHTKINLSDLVIDACEIVSPMAQHKQLTIHTEIEAGITLQGDYDALLRACMNILENAIKFTDVGTITVNLYHTPTAVILSIRDTGVGIHPDQVRHIFDRFYRAPLQHAQPGSGIGLSIVKQIVTMHAGHIRVQSTVQQGTTFVIQLPRTFSHKKPSRSRVTS